MTNIKREILNICKYIGDVLIYCLKSENSKRKLLFDGTFQYHMASLYLYRLSDITFSTTYRHAAENVLDLSVEGEKLSGHFEEIISQGLSAMLLLRLHYCIGDEDDILEDCDNIIFRFADDVLTEVKEFSLREMTLVLLYYALRMRRTIICADDKQIMLLTYQEILNKIYMYVISGNTTKKMIEKSAIFNFADECIILAVVLSHILHGKKEEQKAKRILEVVIHQMTSINATSEINKIQKFLTVSYISKTVKSKEVDDYLSFLENNIDVLKAINMLDYESVSDLCHGAISQLTLICLYLIQTNNFNLYIIQIEKTLKIIEYSIEKFISFTENKKYIIPQLLKVGMLLQASYNISF